MRGKFIAIEGPDGCGKTTLINDLKACFKRKNVDVVFTREPGGTKIGEKIRELLLDVKNMEMTDYTEAYLYAAARLQHVEELILPNMNRGIHVISDRFAMASICYQGYGRQQNVDFIKKVNAPATEMVGELKYLVLMTNPETGLLRKVQQRELDRLEVEDYDFHSRVYEGYKTCIKDMNAHEIDASGTAENTLRQCVAALEAYGVL